MKRVIKTWQQADLLWAGIEYYSLENCLVSPSDQGYEISSVIIGFYEQKIYRVNYLIRTNTDWETLSVDIVCRHNHKTQTMQLQSDGNGNWQADGKFIEKFQGCIDVDIPLTPFTNSLPINRLKLANAEKQQIKVIYFDLLQEEVRPVHQHYSRLSESEYHYENVPNDFEATIRVDDQGFVVDYPELFTRTAKQIS
jgi:uncharacterized protein